MTPRQLLRLTSWPDPLLQERIEDIGFFYDDTYRTWVRFCGEDESEALGQWLKKHSLGFDVGEAAGRGEFRRHPKLSDELVVRDGGNARMCALCGAKDVPCREWVEGDDTDAVDVPGAARFYMCGKCVQGKMAPHPRLYAPAEDRL